MSNVGTMIFNAFSYGIICHVTYLNSISDHLNTIYDISQTNIKNKF